MNIIESMREFLGWCSVINILILTLMGVGVFVLRDLISRVNAKVFDMDERSVSREYFRFFGQYKIAVCVLNIAPYIALRIIG